MLKGLAPLTYTINIGVGRYGCSRNPEATKLDKKKFGHPYTLVTRKNKPRKVREDRGQDRGLPD